jgi:hypothetical protein
MVRSLKMVFMLACGTMTWLVTPFMWERKSLASLALPIPRKKCLALRHYQWRRLMFFLSRKRYAERWLMPTLLPQCEDLRRYLVMITGWFGLWKLSTTMDFSVQSTAEIDLMMGVRFPYQLFFFEMGHRPASASIRCTRPFHLLQGFPISLFYLQFPSQPCKRHFRS